MEVWYFKFDNDKSDSDSFAYIDKIKENKIKILLIEIVFVIWEFFDRYKIEVFLKTYNNHYKFEKLLRNSFPTFVTSTTIYICDQILQYVYQFEIKFHVN